MIFLEEYYHWFAIVPQANSKGKAIDDIYNCLCVCVCAHERERESSLTNKFTILYPINPMSFLTSPWDRKMASQNPQGTKGQESFIDVQNRMMNQTR